jgi:ankyrin repeat protein
MPQSIRSFDRMTIPAPCDADWNSMIGNDRVRFCEHCNLHVTNLSSLTRQEAMRLVARSAGRLCVRFVQRPDGTALTKQMPQKFHQIGRRVSRFAAGAFSATLSLSTAAAQSSSRTSAQQLMAAQVAVKTEDACTLSGIISDPNGAVIADASITLTSAEMHTLYTYNTSDDGMYKFSLLSAGEYLITVEAPSFAKIERKLVLVDGEKTLHIELAIPEITAKVDVRPDRSLVVSTTAGMVAFIEPEDPLVKAAFKDDLELLKDLVFSSPDINARDKNTHMTALEQAVENGNLEILRTLLLAGASPNAPSETGRSALMYLRDNATPELARELISAGARIDARDESGGTPLMNGASETKYEVVKELLEAGAKADLRDAEGMTALMFAAKTDDPRVTKLLIDAGADVRAQNNEGLTALMIACEEGDAETVKLLLSFNAEVNAVDNEQRTALMYVAETSDVESAEALLNASADVSLRDKEGKTALGLARAAEHQEMIKLLESRGAPE